MMILLIILIVLLIILLLWMTGFLFATDFSVPLRDARQFHHVLVIFPHADDEAITCGGALHRLSGGGRAGAVVLFTQGERGANATRNRSPKEVRTRESRAVTPIPGSSKTGHRGFRHVG